MEPINICKNCLFVCVYTPSCILFKDCTLNMFQKFTIYADPIIYGINELLQRYHCWSCCPNTLTIVSVKKLTSQKTFLWSFTLIPSTCGSGSCPKYWQVGITKSQGAAPCLTKLKWNFEETLGFSYTMCTAYYADLSIVGTSEMTFLAMLLALVSR